jgi:hypothetical protein
MRKDITHWENYDVGISKENISTILQEHYTKDASLEKFLENSLLPT